MTSSTHPAQRPADRTPNPPPGGTGAAAGNDPAAAPVPDIAAPAPAGAGAAGPGPGPGPALRAMLEARTVALVGASPREGSLGQRMVSEVARSRPAPRTHLVNPRYQEIDGRPCHPSLADLPGPVDLVLLAVPDTALEEQLALAARRGDRSAVIFGSAHELPGPTAGLRARLAATASAAGMAVCGAGCMGFVNVARGLRAVGYLEPDPLPRGPVALVTHSGSVFSALLRTRRALGFTLAVSSGQELVTGAGQYADYALSMEGTRVLALVLEALREPGRMRAVLAAAAARDIPVVLLTAGSTARGRAMVAAHSGALAAADGGWEALARAYGVHRVRDLAEMSDTLELFAIGRLPGRAAAAGPGPGTAAGPAIAPGSDAGRSSPAGPAAGMGIATVHDSGLERAHVADVAEELGVPFAAIGPPTLDRLAGLLDPGLEPAEPAGRVGHRRERAGPAGRLAGGAGRRPGGGRRRARRGPGAGVRRRPVLPARGAGRRPAQRHAVRGAQQCARCHRPGHRGRAAGGRDPGAGGNPQRPARAAPPARPRGPGPGRRRSPARRPGRESPAR